MSHLKADQPQSRPHRRRVDDRTHDVVALQQGPPQQPQAAHSARLLAGVLAGMGSGSHRRHGRTVSAGRARHVRLPRRLLLARAGPRSAEPRARLDRQVRVRAKGLAQDRPRVSGMNAMLTRILRPSRALAGSFVLLAVARRAAAAHRRHRTLYIGGWPNKIFVIDEATEKVTGTIDVASPARRSSSRCRRTEALLPGQLASARKSRSSTSRRGRAIDHFTLSEGSKKVRIRSMSPIRSNAS